MCWGLTEDREEGQLSTRSRVRRMAVRKESDPWGLLSTIIKNLNFLAKCANLRQE